MKIDGSLARNIDFEAIQSVKIEEVSHEMLGLILPRVSSRVSGFPVASPCL